MRSNWVKPLGWDNRTGACADTCMQAWDGDGQVGLELHYAGLLDQADRADGAVAADLVVGTDDFTLIVEIADPVAVNYCTDAISERALFAGYEAISGIVRLVMESPNGEAGDGLLDVELIDVVFAGGEGHQVTVPAWSVQDITVVRNWGG